MSSARTFQELLHHVERECSFISDTVPLGLLKDSQFRTEDIVHSLGTVVCRKCRVFAPPAKVQAHINL